MYISASTIQQVYNLILNDKFYEDILKKFLTNKNQRNEFRQELWIYICEMPEKKILDAWNRRYFKYLYVAIVKNQVASKSSRWHLKFRSPQIDGKRIEFVEDYENSEDIFSFEESAETEIIKKEKLEEFEKKLLIISDTINKIRFTNPKFFVKSELFKMYYYEEQSYRDIAKKTKIPLVTVFAYVKEAEQTIKDYIDKHYYNK